MSATGKFHIEIKHCTECVKSSIPRTLIEVLTIFGSIPLKIIQISVRAHALLHLEKKKKRKEELWKNLPDEL